MDQQEDHEEDVYEMQHFGELSASSYTSFVKLKLLTLFNDAFDAFRAHLLLNDSEYIVKDVNCDQPNYETAINETMEEFKISAKQFFSIPKNILLPGDLPYKQYENNIDELRATVEKYEKEYVKNKIYLTMLEEEMENLNKIEPIRENMNELLKSKNTKKIPEAPDFPLKTYIAIYNSEKAQSYIKDQ